MDIVKFEFLKLLKKSRGWLGPILVFVLIMIAYPLTVEVSNIELNQTFFSILWIAALLVIMLATEDIFLEDFNDGSIEQYAVSHQNLSFIVATKIFIYWLVIGIPISTLGSIFCIGITNQSNLGFQILPVLLMIFYVLILVHYDCKIWYYALYISIYFGLQTNSLLLNMNNPCLFSILQFLHSFDHRAYQQQLLFVFFSLSLYMYDF